MKFYDSFGGFCVGWGYLAQYIKIKLRDYGPWPAGISL